MVFTVLHYIVLIRVNVSINKRVVSVFILFMLSFIIYCLIVVKKREPKGEELCIEVHTNNNNICDADPLDNPSNKAQLIIIYVMLIPWTIQVIKHS